MLVVVVQERPSIRSLRGHRQQGDQDRGSRQVAAQRRPGAAARSSIAPRSRTCASSSSSSTSRAGTTTCGSTRAWRSWPATWSTCSVDIVEGKRARIRQINVVGNERFSDEELLAELELKRDATCCRSIAATIATRAQSLEGRPGEDPLLLHGSRLRGLRDHLDAGGAGAGEGRPVHHRERLRGRHLEDRRGEARGPVRGAARKSCGSTWSSGRATCTRSDSSPRAKRRLRNRLGEAGFAFADVAAVPTRGSRDAARSRSPSRSSRTRAPTCGASNSRASSKRATRSCGARCASSRARVMSNAALQRSEERLQRLPYIDEGGVRDAPRARQRGPRRRGR